MIMAHSLARLKKSMKLKEKSIFILVKFLHSILDITILRMKFFFTKKRLLCSTLNCYHMLELVY